MSGSIAVSILLAVVVTGSALVLYRRRRSRDALRVLGDLSPVSGQWLADQRRSG